MTIPTIHLNGTGRDALTQQVRDARRAIGAAIDALAMATPHGRDYYLQGDHALPQALREHAARMTALRTVADELGELAQAIVDAGRA